MKPKILVIAAALVVVLAGGGFRYFAGSQAPEPVTAAAPPPPEIPVVAATVASKDVPIYLQTLSCIRERHAVGGKSYLKLVTTKSAPAVEATSQECNHDRPSKHDNQPL